jgi:dihydroorotate dehydrogenase
MTTAVHHIFAGAIAVFLYSALVPKGHGAHSAWLHRFLSWHEGS